MAMAVGLTSPVATRVSEKPAGKVAAPAVEIHRRQHDAVSNRDRGWTADILAPFKGVPSRRAYQSALTSCIGQTLPDSGSCDSAWSHGSLIFNASK